MTTYHNNKRRRMRRRKTAILNYAAREGQAMEVMANVREEWGILLGRAQTRERSRGDSTRDTMVVESFKLPCDIRVSVYRFWGFLTLDVTPETVGNINLAVYGLQYNPDFRRWCALTNWLSSQQFVEFSSALQNVEDELC